VNQRRSKSPSGRRTKKAVSDKLFSFGDALKRGLVEPALERADRGRVAAEGAER
jgi:hypothetical protein